MREQDEQAKRPAKLETCDAPHHFYGLRCQLPEGHVGAHRAMVAATWDESAGALALDARR